VLRESELVIKNKLHMSKKILYIPEGISSNEERIFKVNMLYVNVHNPLNSVRVC